VVCVRERPQDRRRLPRHTALRHEARALRRWPVLLLEAFRAAASLSLSGTRPDPGPECPWCHYAATWAQR
jgi:hypothetical protein